MKWCFLINSASCLPEFLGKLGKQAVKENDECIVILSSKIAEYSKKVFFPKETKFISMIDWFTDNYKENKNDFSGLTWKEFFPLFYRNKWVKIDYDKSVETALQHIQFFKFIFENEKPDMIVSESPSGFFHEVAYLLSRKNKVPYLGVEVSKLENRIDIYDSGFLCSKYEETFNQLKDIDISCEEKEYAQKFVKGFISHEVSPDLNFDKVYSNRFGFIGHYLKRLKEVGGLLLKYMLKRNTYKNFDCESESVLKVCFSAPFRRKKRQLKTILQKNVFPKMEKNSDQFFIYPLHFQPESTTSIYATYYYDQLNTIKNIAFALPFPYKLYVKEHPVSVGTRHGSFYKQLRELPNVVLVGPYENVEQLIRKSEGVVVLTGTIGMEAALAGKPAYVLGSVYYSFHPFCRRLKNFEELRDRIKDDLINKPDKSNLDNINNRFIAAYFRNTMEGDLLSASTGQDKNNYRQILKTLREFPKTRT